MARVLMLVTGILFSLCLAKAQNTTYLCAAAGHRTTNELFIGDNETIPLTCVFPRITGAVFGVYFYLEPEWPYTVLYNISQSNISVAANNATANIANTTITLNTTMNDTMVTLTLNNVTVEGIFDCLFSYNAQEFIRGGFQYFTLNDVLHKPARNKTFVYACALEAYSWRGVSAVEPLKWDFTQEVAVQTCTDDGENTTTYNVSVGDNGGLCRAMSIYCLDTLGNFWRPDTLNHYGRPPQCMHNRSIVPRRNGSRVTWLDSDRRYTVEWVTPYRLSSPVPRTVIPTVTVTQVRQRGSFAGMTAVLDFTAIFLIILSLAVLRALISEHQTRHYPNKPVDAVRHAWLSTLGTRRKRHIYYRQLPPLYFYSQKPWLMY
ncbi:membrane protein A25D [Aotine betaherpesvirus 1]|uniref:Membrane protein A25D n=1 Tax=Aotine betaherpesvirus 1 TaxID=50290 RepID=G8XUJ6_9BETA|nr:membrane protein A25D [Aotine betaherpesvirus 1]AEV80837.1 membrane protein A25D [Aotine betaherpesvirus 1]